MHENINWPILIVDDNEDLLVAYNHLLSRNGYKVTCTGTGKGALDLIGKEYFSLILLDVVLPDISGLEVLKIIKSNPANENLFVVLMSALAITSANQSEGLETGADGYLLKPVENREFIARIEAFLRHKKTVDELRASELKFKLLANSNIDGILILDAESRVRFANPAAEEMFKKGNISILNTIFNYSVPGNGILELTSYSGPGIQRSVEMLISELEWEGKQMKLISLREITQRRIAEAKVNEHLVEQKLISEVAKKMVSIKSKDELYKYIGERIYEITGNAYVFVSAYDTEKQIVHVKHLFGFGKVLGKIKKTFNIDAYNIKVGFDKLTREQLAIFTSNEMVKLPDNGIYMLTAGTINENICRAVEMMLGIKDINVMGFTSDNKYFGGLGIFSKEMNPFKQHKLVENLVSQASVALQKLYAEEKLQQEHDNLNAILSSSPVGMLVIDENECIIKANPAVCQMFNKDFSDLKDSLSGDFFACVNSKINGLGCGYSLNCKSCIILSSIRNALAGKQIISDQEAQIFRITENGPVEVWLRFSIEPLVLNGRQHIIIALHDNTISKMAEDEIRRTEKHFRSLIENSADAIVLTDAQSIIRYESPAFSRMMGWQPFERIGKSSLELIHPDDLDDIKQLMMRILLYPGDSYHAIFRQMHSDGKWRWIEGTCSNFLEEPAIRGLVVNIHDITDRKQAEEALNQKIEEIERFNDLTVGRELKMIELKKEINALIRSQGGKDKYKIVV